MADDEQAHDEERPARIMRPAMPGIPGLPADGIPPLTEEQFAQVLELFKQQDPSRDWESPIPDLAERLAEARSGAPPVQEPGDGPPYDLAERMAELGAPDPNGWARSELQENIAQEARWLLIKRLWQKCIAELHFSANQHADALVVRGADAGLMDKALKLAAFQTLFTTLYELDDSYDPALPVDRPGWQLMETRLDVNGDAQLTGREVAALYESLRQGDLTGNEGNEFI